MNNQDPAAQVPRAAEVSRLIRSGRVEQARRACREAIEAGRGDASMRVLLAACEQRLGNPGEAVSALEHAARESADPLLLQHVADAMLKLSAFRAAAAVIARLDAARPESVLLQARCRWGQGEYAAAVEQLGVLSDIVPGWPLLAVSHARMRINLDQPDRALAILDRALAEHPRDPSLLHQKALLLVSMHGCEAARAWAAPRCVDAQLVGLVDALSAVTGRDAPADHPGEGWAGLRALLAEAVEDTAWYGDNVALLKAALARAPAEGAVVECGVHHGRTVNLLAGWVPERRVHGFDSFLGLPEAWSQREPAGSYSTGGRIPQTRANVELAAGWFAETLPAFAGALSEPIALLHVDCDLYSSTVEVLSALGPLLADGAVVVFDEYTGYAGWREHEYRAWREHRERTGITATLVGAQLLGNSAAFEVAGS